jgi:FtsP/CotA-like multicopper oxidase with cupredoxin domain
VTHVQTSHTINVSKDDEWLQVVIVNSGSMAHPIHLHGHDFYVLEQTSTNYNPDSVKLNTKNPPRRDVVVLQPDGYLVLAIEADNPGAWLMHCHVAFHAAEGMSIQITERMDEAAKLVLERKGGKDAMQNTCDAWKLFQEKDGFDQLGRWEPGP